MALQVAELSLQLIETLRPLMGRIKARDKSLADQLARAANSVALNLGEAQHSDPGNRRARLFTAARLPPGGYSRFRFARTLEAPSIATSARSLGRADAILLRMRAARPITGTRVPTTVT